MDNYKYEENFAERISSLRTQKGVSAREMSLAIGQNSSYINRIENKQTFPSMQSFFYICEYLDIAPNAFFDYEIEDPTKLQKTIIEISKLNPRQLDIILTITQEFLRKKG